MGWDGTIPTHYKGFKVDKKAELDDEYTWESEDRVYTIVKSSMVGSVYYGALKIHCKNEDKEDFITAIVAPTRMDNGFLMKKTMEESVGPYYYDCPTSILELLSPTEDKWALKWRAKCYQKKRFPNLSKLKEGTIIRFICPVDTRFYKEGETITLEKTKTIKRCNGRDTYKWLSDGYISWSSKMIPNNFEIIKEG